MKLAVALLLCASCVPSTRDTRAPIDRELDARIAIADGSDPPVVAVPLPVHVVEQALAQPLTARIAVRLALAQNPEMRVAFAKLGIAASDLAVGIGMLDVTGAVRFVDGKTEYDVTATQDILGLLTAARTRHLGRATLAAARADATAAALRLAATVEIAFNDTVAATASLELATQTAIAADAAATLRERMYSAGNATPLAVARERDGRDQAKVLVIRARGTLAVARQHLASLLALTDDQITRLAVVAPLPTLPEATPALEHLEHTAATASLDLAAGRSRVEAAEVHASRERLGSVLPRLGVGVSIGRGHEDGKTAIGPAISLGIPLFDWNQRGRARANAELHVAESTVDAVALQLRATARAARERAQAAYAEAVEWRDVVVPLRQTILEEAVKHYNAMDADPFALVVARRELADAGLQLVDATRRFWNQMAIVAALERGAVPDAGLAN